MLILAGCGARTSLAPVSDYQYSSYSSSPGTHIVRRGETLYAIAFGLDTDFRTLASLNNLRPPYKLLVGQVLRTQHAALKRVAPLKHHYAPQHIKQEVQQTKPSIIRTPSLYSRLVSGWQWPAKGQVTTTFIPTQGKKGINIACQKGEKVYAASSGVVAYAGSGLQGYGNLIIIKHNNEFLTAYGNNAKNLVSEGQHVSSGQPIAEVGLIDHKYWGVHFEIRKMGVPVNPLNYLQKG